MIDYLSDAKLCVVFGRLNAGQSQIGKEKTKREKGLSIFILSVIKEDRTRETVSTSNGVTTQG